MRTEQDLRTVLAAREDLAPEPDRVLAGARQAAAGHRRRHRTAGALGAAAVAVAAVLAVPAMLTGGSSPGPGPAPAPPPGAAPTSTWAAPEPLDPADPRPPYAFTISPGTVAGFEIWPTSVAPDYQIARIQRPGEEEPAAELVIYQPDAGVEVTGDDPVLRWEFPSGGHAEIVSASDPPLDEQTAQRLADGLQFTAPYQARLPYRLDYLPAGVSAFNVGQETAAPGAFRSVIQLERDDPSDWLTFDIMVADGYAEPDNPDWDWQPATVADRPAECVDLVDGRRCRVEFDEFTVSIGSGTLESDELTRLVAGLHPATWDDPSTWYEIDDALPTS